MFSSQGNQHQTCFLKERIDIKLINVPPTKEIVAESIRELSARHLNKLIIISGTCVRTGNINSRELKKKFACKSCGCEYICESDITEYNKFITPVSCDGLVEKKVNPFFQIAQKMMKKGKNNRQGSNDREGGNQRGNNGGGGQPDNKVKCNARSFVPIDDPTTAQYADYQEIKVQETFKTLKPGLIPRSICVILQNTLVESVKPGDDVMLTGILI